MKNTTISRFKIAFYLLLLFFSQLYSSTNVSRSSQVHYLSNTAFWGHPLFISNHTLMVDFLFILCWNSGWVRAPSPASFFRIFSFGCTILATSPFWSHQLTRFQTILLMVDSFSNRLINSGPSPTILLMVVYILCSLYFV